MKIEIDYDKLKLFFSEFIERNIGCNECPFYDMCNGTDDSDECAEIYIDNLVKGDPK